MSQSRPRAVATTRAFERDVKRLRKRGSDMGRLRRVVEALRLGQDLEPRYRDHPLSGDWHGFRDCHRRLARKPRRFSGSGGIACIARCINTHDFVY
jgi:hypothetical protein